MKLTEQEKLEMLQDGLDKNRRNDFRAAQIHPVPLDWKEFNLWLNQIQTILPKSPLKNYIEYKRALL